MKKFIAIILTALCILSLASCGGSEEKANKITKSADEIRETLSKEFDLSDLDLLTNEDEFVDNILFIYGVSGELKDSVESFFITNTHRSTDARAIAVFKMKEGAEDKVADLKNGLNNTFLANLVNMTATYDPEQAKIANSATIKTYDNAVVLVSYDPEDNSKIIEAIEG